VSRSAYTHSHHSPPTTNTHPRGEVTILTSVQAHWHRIHTLRCQNLITHMIDPPDAPAKHEAMSCSKQASKLPAVFSQ